MIIEFLVTSALFLIPGYVLSLQDGRLRGAITFVGEAGGYGIYGLMQ